MAGVPYTFSTASQSIPLAQLDANFATPIVLGSSTAALGQTVTTLNNLTLSNVTILSGTATLNNLTGNVTFGNTTVNLGNSSSSIGNLTLINTTINSAAQLSIGTPAQNTQLGQGNASSLKNRIINGAMVIDQRNAGASGTATFAYTIDRWVYSGIQPSKGTWQQNAGSVTPPIGFTNYLGFTSSSSYAVLSGDYFSFQQPIEGYNFADLMWGTANAKPIVLSLQVYSSLTGTFGGALQNSAQTRSYPFTYSIPVANTWTTISIPIVGDTSGTWVGATNGVGCRVQLGLGSGSTYSGTAGAWATGNFIQPTGTVSVVGTSGATFYVTGAQLEVGSQASGFEYRQYGTELALCQRYYSVINMNAQAPSPGFMITPFYGPVTMRTIPTITQLSGGTQTNATIQAVVANTNQPAGYLQILASLASGVIANASYSASAEL